MDQVLTEMTTSIQGDEETCEEFMDRVMFVARLLQVWDPSVLPSDDFLMAGLTSRFQSLRMPDELLAPD